MQNTPFDRYKKNVHSQNGEDGVIAELLSRLNPDSGSESWCVEFGAWDGRHLSNTFLLVEKGWNAVYIEGDKIKYQDLLNTARDYPKIIPVNNYVDRYSTDNFSLDSILSKTSLPKEFAVLSIDIDSYDLDVWESLAHYEPKIVIIEINSSAPPGLIWRHSDRTTGNTFSATHRVGVHKGYTLVCHTGNMIFVKNGLLSKLDIEQRYIDFPELLFLYDWVSLRSI